MGTGNKLNPSMLQVADIYDTKICPLAKVMRHELRKRGVPALKVVYSEEIPITPAPSGEQTAKRAVPGSTAFVPPSAGLLIASEVVKDLIK
jgi:tRNA A37 threonylcarbamoyladenosine dehydratase